MAGEATIPCAAVPTKGRENTLSVRPSVRPAPGVWELNIRSKESGEHTPGSPYEIAIKPQSAPPTPKKDTQGRLFDEPSLKFDVKLAAALPEGTELLVRIASPAPGQATYSMDPAGFNLSDSRAVVTVYPMAPLAPGKDYLIHIVVRTSTLPAWRVCCH